MKAMIQTTNTSSTQVLEQSAVLRALEHSLAMIEFDVTGKVLWVNDIFAKSHEIFKGRNDWFKA